jgi:hypothetical protein
MRAASPSGDIQLRKIDGADSRMSPHHYSVRAARQMCAARNKPRPLHKIAAFFFAARCANGVCERRRMIFAAGLRDLNDLINPVTGWQLFQAHDINNAGQIVANGRVGNDGSLHALLLTPVPEHQAVVLCGVAGASILRRRRR